MGLRNSTCMLSGLPISRKVRVHLVLVQQQFPDESPVTPEDTWAPRSMPIPGVYNSYGGANVKDGSLKQAALNAFQRDLISDHPRTRGPFSKEEVTWKNVIGTASGEELIVDGHVPRAFILGGREIPLSERKVELRPPKPVRVGIALIRSDVWRAYAQLITDRSLSLPTRENLETGAPLCCPIGPNWHYIEAKRLAKPHAHYRLTVLARQLLMLRGFMHVTGQIWHPSYQTLPQTEGHWKEFEQIADAIHRIAKKHRGRPYAP